MPTKQETGLEWLTFMSTFSDGTNVILATVSKEEFYEQLVAEDVIEDTEEIPLECFLQGCGEGWISYRLEEDDADFDGEARFLGAKPNSKGSHKVRTWG